MNGDQNVTNAKNAAKNALNNLTSINNAQKRDLTTKIDQATTVSGVEAVSNTGTQLNTAMANLQNGINDKAHTLASETIMMLIQIRKLLILKPLRTQKIF